MKTALCTNRLMAALVLLVSSILSVSTLAETYKPANFAFQGDDLLRLVVLSDSQSGVTLYCRADIGADGKANRANCYDSGGNLDLEVQTQDALAALTFTPASVNGEPVPVRMSFRVAYVSVEKGIKAILIPNLGTMQAQYGRDYFAPQERLDVADWYENYSKGSWVSGGEFLEKGELARVAATVREDGKPTMVRTVEAGRAYRRDAEVVESALKRSRFIPGFVGDKPVPMGYLAVVNYGSRREAVSSR